VAGADSSNKKKLRTKDFRDEFDEIQSNDDLNISLTISKSSSSASQVEKLEKEEVIEAGEEEVAAAGATNT